MFVFLKHYNDVIMDAMASPIASVTIVYSTVYSGWDQRKHQSSASLAFVRGIHRWPVNSRTKGQERGKCFQLSIWWRHHESRWIKCELIWDKIRASIDRAENVLEISRRLEATMSAVDIRLSFCNLTGAPALLLQTDLSNCRSIGNL